MNFKTKFVECIPVNMAGSTIYLTKDFKESGHVCPCGCGHQVRVDLVGIRIIHIHLDGSVSFAPSFHNYRCGSTYSIIRSQLSGSARWK